MRAPKIEVRKTFVTLERVYHDTGPVHDVPLRRGVIVTVLRNPYAGRYEPDLIPWMDALRPFATAMAHELLDALGGDASAIETYGKGAMVGANGELEHAALWHSPGGGGLREALGGGKGLVPGNQKMAAVGASLDIPLGNVDDHYVRSHFDGISIMVPDAPRADEVAFALAMGTGGRLHARLGGVTAAEARKAGGRA